MKIIDGKKIYPRPELLNEIHSQTEIQFYMYSSEKFLEYSQEYFNLTIQNEIIDDLKNFKIYNVSNPVDYGYPLFIDDEINKQFETIPEVKQNEMFSIFSLFFK